MVISQVVPVQTLDCILATISIYADDICIWVASKNHLVEAVQAATDQLGPNLANIGLEVSVHKPRFVCFWAPEALRMRGSH